MLPDTSKLLRNQHFITLNKEQDPKSLLSRFREAYSCFISSKLDYCDSLLTSFSKNGYKKASVNTEGCDQIFKKNQENWAHNFCSSVFKQVTIYMQNTFQRATTIKLSIVYENLFLKSFKIQAQHPLKDSDGRSLGSSQLGGSLGQNRTGGSCFW